MYSNTPVAAKAASSPISFTAVTSRYFSSFVFSDDDDVKMVTFCLAFWPRINPRTRQIAAQTLSNGVCDGGVMNFFPSSSKLSSHSLFFSSMACNTSSVTSSTTLVIVPDCIMAGPTRLSNLNNLSIDSLIKSVSANKPSSICFLCSSLDDSKPPFNRILQMETKTSLSTPKGCMATGPWTPVTTNSTVFKISTLRFSSFSVGNARTYVVNR
mmetsp:Transcript_31498/g.76020  ORF Transcript_31498/g.76020 Transcript_31498/m.76020 type:complete len:212 (-) Transcript_31498:1649-2284(-)